MRKSSEDDRHDGLRLLDGMVGKLICEMRQYHGISRDVLSGLIGRPPEEIEQWEAGDRPVDLPTLWLMAEALGFRVEYFTYGLTFSVDDGRWDMEPELDALPGPNDPGKPETREL